MDDDFEDVKGSLAGTAIVQIEAMTPEAAFAPGKIPELLDRIEKEARSFDLDVTTKPGRELIAKVAHAVARSKTTLDAMGKSLTEEWRKQTGEVNASRRVVTERLDALKAEIRQPLTDFENAEKNRVAEHRRLLAEIEGAPLFAEQDTPIQTMRDRLAMVERLGERDWQEFTSQARFSITQASDRLRARITDAEDLARLRAEAAQRAAEAAERERQEREARIAEDAARRAREQAEAAAAEATRRAEADAAERERRLQAQADRAQRETAEATERERRLAQQLADAQQQEKVSRRGGAVAAIAPSAGNRKSQIENAIVAALKQHAMSDARARRIIEAINKGEIPHVAITY